jgi:hypothetical protein
VLHGDHHLRELALAPREGNGVGPERPQRPGRREVGAQIGNDQLVEPFGTVEVLEFVHPEVVEAEVGQDVVDEDGVRRLREQDLAAVSRGADAGGAVDAEADVALAGDRRLGRVHAHAHAQVALGGPGMSAEGPLGGERGGDGRLRARKDDEERVALRVDLASACVGDRLPEQPLLVGEQVAVGVAQAFEQTSRAFDVGEEEGDGSRGQL